MSDSKRKVLLDCGTNLGQGLSALIEKFNVDASWEIYSFEANPVTFQHVSERFRNNPLPIKFLNKAVWSENCKRKLTMEVWPGKVETAGHYFGEDLPVGGGSNILEGNFIKPACISTQNIYPQAVEVECLDLCEFIEKHFTPEDHIILKLDCEGAEYPILEKMIARGTLRYVKEMFVEWHNRMLLWKYDENAILNEISRQGIPCHPWA